MRGIAQERSPCRHALEDSAASLDAQIGVDSTECGNESNARLAAVGVEIIDDQSEGSFRVGADHVVEILKKVFFRACLAKHRGDDFSGRDMQISKQTDGAMATILIFTFRHRTWLGKQVGFDSFQCLNARLLIDRNRMDALLFIERNGLTVSTANQIQSPMVAGTVDQNVPL